MKRIFFTVGPSQIYPTVTKHLNLAIKQDVLSLNHRGQEFKGLFKEVTKNLKKLLNIPENYQVFFVSSALECMERVISSCCQKASFHIITGAFGRAWAGYAKELGKSTYTFAINPTQQTDLDKINIPEETEIICITQNDTSTGYWIPPEEITKLKQKYPYKLIAMDAVSSIPYVKLDYSFLDVVFFSVQKGMGLPPGLAVMIVSPQALQKTEILIKKRLITGSYHSLKRLSEKAVQLQTPETPNVLNIFLLNCVVKDMLKQKITKIRQDTDKKAQALYNFFNNHQKFKPFIPNTQNQSPTTAVFDIKGKSETIRNKLTKAGFLIGAGYGDNKQNHIRIANFPSHSITDLKRMLKYIP